MFRKRITGVTLAALVAAAVTPLAVGAVERTAAGGTLAFRANFVLKVSSHRLPGRPETAISCFAAPARASSPGSAGSPSRTSAGAQENPAGCGSEYVPHPEPDRPVRVAGKGELQLVVPATGCMPFVGLEVPIYPALHDHRRLGRLCRSLGHGHPHATERRE